VRMLHHREPRRGRTRRYVTDIMCALKCFRPLNNIMLCVLLLGLEVASAAWLSVPLRGVAGTTSQSLAAKSLNQGDCVILAESVASVAECEFLVAACSATAREYSLDSGSAAGLIRLPSLAAAARTRVMETAYDRALAEGLRVHDPAAFAVSARTLSGAADAVCEAILLRVFDLISTELQAVASLQFGLGTDSCQTTLAELYAADELQWAAREPAVNVYSRGGEFRPHKDHQSLTVLVPLSSPEDFEGGGTGFWSPELETGRTVDAQVDAPAVVLRPARGTAMLFGGDVTHGGMQLLAGSRVVFVASFSGPGRSES
jgi:hypothetical protein